MGKFARDMGRVVALILLLAALGTGCTRRQAEREPDPYEGYVQVPDGAGGHMWIKPYEDVAPSTLTADDFYTDPDTGWVKYMGLDYRAVQGIDVSFYQGQIRWQEAADAGIGFAMIRAGYRGASEGILYEDERFRENIQGALDAGLEVGVYFFSQAVTAEEAVEEADMVLELIEDYELSLPVAFDWEYIGSFEARTDEISGRELTDICLAFCDRIGEAGYDSAVYLYRHTGYEVYQLDRLEDIGLWVATHGSWPDFYYRHEIWQYAIDGRVPGIDAAVDLDLLFLPAEPADRTGV